MPFEKEIARQYFRTTMIKEIVRFHYTKRTILRQDSAAYFKLEFFILLFKTNK
jgi:hypothetical protein